MSQKQIFYILFFTALVLVFYFIVPWRKTEPISNLPSFSFTNQLGKQVTEKDITGKVVVATYFFTTCKGICPEMNGNLKKVYEKFKNEKDFVILSHTSDPAVDSVPVLKEYAERFGAEPEKWIFLTGSKDSLYNKARFFYKIDDPANNPKSNDDIFLHTQFWALVQKNGEIRKIYDGLKPKELKALMQDIEKALKK